MRGISGDLGAREIIRMLDLTPHPEGGHFRETYRAPTSDGSRASSTMIYYLLQADEVSAWHRVDADEFWLWHAGGPLSLTLSPPDGQGASAVTLGPDRNLSSLRNTGRQRKRWAHGHWSVVLLPRASNLAGLKWPPMIGVQPSSDEP